MSVRHPGAHPRRPLAVAVALVDSATRAVLSKAASSRASRSRSTPVAGDPDLPARRCPRALAVAVGLVTTGVLTAAPASAQLDPGNFDIRQGSVLVGQIYVPERGEAAQHYMEHWMVSAAYVFPSLQNRVATEIIPAGRRYADEKDFLRRVDLGPGARYIRVVAHEHSGMSLASGPASNRSGTGLMGTDVPAPAVPLAIAVAVGVRLFRRRIGGLRPACLEHERTVRAAPECLSAGVLRRAASHLSN